MKYIFTCFHALMNTENTLHFLIHWVALRLLSPYTSIFLCLVKDQHIHKFLKMCHQIEGRLLSPTRNTEGNLEMVLRKSILDLPKAREEPLVRFLHIILDKLVLLLVRPPIISGIVGKYMI
jgi:hypothetical protein